MLIAVHRETRSGERRVALTPKGVGELVAAGHTVRVPPGAGDEAGFPDFEFATAGAHLADQGPAADLVVGVGPLSADDVAGAGAILGFLDPLARPDEMSRLAATGATVLALEFVPRTTLAQSMDALSSQATVAGYEAVLVAADVLPRLFPMLMTAAGTIPPARVLVLGAGVAGLQAIATARRLGAVVSGYDIRPAAREQVESLGASFVGGPVVDDAEDSGGYAAEVDDETRKAQQAALEKAVATSDVIVTTAQVPGRRAPLLLTREMVESMKPGAVVVDMAASSGGNCEVTVAGELILHGPVRVIGPLHLASRAAGHASEMLSRNLQAVIDHVTEGGALAIDPEDEIVAEMCIAHGGTLTHDRMTEGAD